MSKFAKTCYPWQGNHKNFIKSIQSKGQNNQKITTHQKSTSDEINIGKKSQPYQNILDKKLQIDPSLLFSKKNPKNLQCRNMGQKLKRQNRDMASTSTGGFYKPSQQRPQSKQNSRIKLRKNNQSLQKTGKQIQRPQTSKGQRNIVYNRERCEKKKKTLGNQEEQVSIQIKRTVKTASGGRTNSNMKKIELQTSIDPQFLALFAS